MFELTSEAPCKCQLSHRKSWRSQFAPKMQKSLTFTFSSTLSRKGWCNNRLVQSFFLQCKLLDCSKKVEQSPFDQSKMLRMKVFLASFLLVIIELRRKYNIFYARNGYCVFLSNLELQNPLRSTIPKVTPCILPKQLLIHKRTNPLCHLGTLGHLFPKTILVSICSFGMLRI